MHHAMEILIRRGGTEEGQGQAGTGDLTAIACLPFTVETFHRFGLLYSKMSLTHSDMMGLTQMPCRGLFEHKN